MSPRGASTPDGATGAAPATSSRVAAAAVRFLGAGLDVDRTSPTVPPLLVRLHGITTRRLGGRWDLIACLGLARGRRVPRVDSCEGAKSYKVIEDLSAARGTRTPGRLGAHSELFSRDLRMKVVHLVKERGSLASGIGWRAQRVVQSCSPRRLRPAASDRMTCYQLGRRPLGEPWQPPHMLVSLRTRACMLFGRSDQLVCDGSRAGPARQVE